MSHPAKNLFDGFYEETWKFSKPRPGCPKKMTWATTELIERAIELRSDYPGNGYTEVDAHRFLTTNVGIDRTFLKLILAEYSGRTTLEQK